ncbi:MAG: ABC transporter permease [Sedimentisphaerales bacterium]|jgi:predicted permease|nr:ABC transporter permease [Sedimentisphaerales bacterium]
MGTLWQDIRFGLRMLAKNRGFTAIALVTLAVGIGANTIMFSVVNAMLFRPMHVREPDRLVYCGIREFGLVTYEMYSNMRDDNPVFSDLIAHNWGYCRGTWVQGDLVRHMDLMYVSANYFSALGVAPAYGRTFQTEQERYGAEPVAVLSYQTWQRLGADPKIVGQYVDINASPCRIVGVAPKRFTGTTASGPDVWLPLGAFGKVDHPDEERPTGRGQAIWDYPAITLIGRLKSGLDMVEAEARLQAMAPRLKEYDPRRWKDDSRPYLARLARMGAGEDEDESKTLSVISAVLMGISGVVLLIACLNLASMITVQGVSRQREIAIRMAIGGGRLRIVRQLFLESFLLALFGGILALIPAFWGVRILNAWLATGTLPIRLTTWFDARVLSATLGFCLIATVLFGLKPALRLSARDVISDLKESGGGVVRSTHRRRRLIPRGLSVVLQIALSVVLVMGATLFTRTALKIAGTRPGFDLAGKLVVRIDPLAGGYTHAQAATACQMLAERLKGTPGIQAAGLSTSFPIGDTRHDFSQRFIAYEPGAADDSSKNLLERGSLLFEADGGYFEAMGIPLLRGRPFRPLDSAADAERVVIIDEMLARKLRPDGNVVDCLIQHGWGSGLDVCRVVGVVPSLLDLSGQAWNWAHIYEPIREDHLPVYIHLRLADTTPRTEAAVVRNLGAQIRKIDPRLPVVSVTSLTDQHRNDGTIRQAAVAARLTAMFGVMALFLAGLGLYAVKGHMVASRTPEIGIRMALGATRRDILALVFRQGAVSTFMGLSLGILLAGALARLIRAGLYGISPLDPLSIAATVTLLAIVSVLAGYIPARRAARVDPMVALRYE